MLDRGSHPQAFLKASSKSSAGKTGEVMGVTRLEVGFDDTRRKPG
jgi:hypothetical protein